MDNKIRLKNEEEVFKVLLAHWINHNAHHVEEYESWAHKLRGTSLDSVSKEIDLAVIKMEEAKKHFMKAKILF